MPRLGQEEYLQLFNKIYEDHSFKGEDICKYDRFIYDVFFSTRGFVISICIYDIL